MFTPFSMRQNSSKALRFDRRIIVQGVEDSQFESLKVAVTITVLLDDFYPRVDGFDRAV